MELAYKQYGEDHNKPALIILHGLFGMLDNWQLQAKVYAQHFRVFTLDQRNHGRSPHSPEMNYDAMAQDIANFCSQLNLENIILMGHSMGGKTAMQVAVNHPEILSKLIVADIAPKAYKAAHTKYFEAFKSIDFSAIESRKEAEEAFAKFESNTGIRLFLLKNLQKAEKGYELKCNLETIERAYPIISGAIEIPYPISIPTLFIKGENSNYINSEDEYEIEQKFTQVEFKTVSKAGHWLHAENTEEYLQKTLEFLLL
jgi:pimeloyl-ACP methyl ester carboxylesterase